MVGALLLKTNTLLLSNITGFVTNKVRMMFVQMLECKCLFTKKAPTNIDDCPYEYRSMFVHRLDQHGKGTIGSDMSHEPVLSLLSLLSSSSLLVVVVVVVFLLPDPQRADQHHEGSRVKSTLELPAFSDFQIPISPDS